MSPRCNIVKERSSLRRLPPQFHATHPVLRITLIFLAIFVTSPPKSHPRMARIIEKLLGCCRKIHVNFMMGTAVCDTPTGLRVYNGVMLTSQANEGEVTLELSLAFQSVHQRHNGISETTNDCSGGMIEVPLVLLSSGSLGSSSEPWDSESLGRLHTSSILS